MGEVISAEVRRRGMRKINPTAYWSGRFRRRCCRLVLLEWKW
jgi:hypothetical protein